MTAYNIHHFIERMIMWLSLPFYLLLYVTTVIPQLKGLKQNYVVFVTKLTNRTT